MVVSLCDVVEEGVGAVVEGHVVRVRGYAGLVECEEDVDGGGRGGGLGWFGGGEEGGGEDGGDLGGVPGCGHAVGEGGVVDDEDVGGGAEAEDGGGVQQFFFAGGADTVGVS